MGSAPTFRASHRGIDDLQIKLGCVQPGEAVATFGLLLTIFGCVARTPSAVPYAVGLYITSAYWFTASTSFANPAVTIARALSDTFAGIAPTGVVAFIIAQLVGTTAAIWIGKRLWSIGRGH